MAEALKVLVVDDSAIYRSLVQGCVRDMPDLTLRGHRARRQDAIAKAAELRPDLILLDVEMPVMGGVEAIPRLRKVVPEAGIIMVSSLTTERRERHHGGAAGRRVRLRDQAAGEGGRGRLRRAARAAARR